MKDLNKRVEQAQTQTIDNIIIKHCNSHSCCMEDNKSEIVNEILDCKYADIIKDVEWVGGSCNVNLVASNICEFGTKGCYTKHIRQATINEVLEFALESIQHNTADIIINGKLRKKV